jgi:hypothetical protein
MGILAFQRTVGEPCDPPRSTSPGIIEILVFTVLIGDRRAVCSTPSASESSILLYFAAAAYIV